MSEFELADIRRRNEAMVADGDGRVQYWTPDAMAIVLKALDQPCRHDTQWDKDYELWSVAFNQWREAHGG